MFVVTGRQHEAEAILARPISRCEISSRVQPFRAAKYAAAKHCQNCPVQSLSLCNSLQHDELAELNSFVTDSHYKNHDILFDQDTPAKWVHIVTEGVVRLHKTLADGRRMVIGFALPGDFLGFSDRDVHATSADALGPVATCRISQEAFQNLLDVKPHLMRRLHTELIHEFTLAQDRLMLLGRCSAKERMAAFFVNLRNRWKRVNGQVANVALPMSRQDIADFLGLTIETVSRMITTLARERVIVIVPDGIRILDLPRLEALAVG
ncbi:helix-turn-helix domain-containing protein [Roseiarcaceae bacterium H3SJ34-1]|uniref:Crp/Fnr family transcriptional regulator n=1 Tax=Terripilifer ovatus TaxID=3032367 RepID=UPI003AB91963|nr:helix-turn-helix domain-containing protein [Roseiarcaceae bacterium H3SJ34-1]